MSELFNWLLSLQEELEWLEFKVNNNDPNRIGEYISSLSNSAAYHGKPFGYLIWGIENSTLNRIGTTVDPLKLKVGNESLENWLIRKVSPRIQIKFHRYYEEGKSFVILEIPSVRNMPTSFDDSEYIRIGPHNQKLKDYTADGLTNFMRVGAKRASSRLR
ncbi:AlbA family DNA-binding domain-containing protein, partial [Deinococcus ruber]|uniref:AlbA family DNA-binding domain-containing protein n=1 Tax=Deinococcus ruber TaxID=1848197 RepID=UPI0016695063